MTTNNTNGNTIVMNADQIATLKSYSSEANRCFNAIAQAKEELKEIIIAAADKTELDKKLIRKVFHTRYKDSLNDVINEMEELTFVVEQLNSHRKE